MKNKINEAICLLEAAGYSVVPDGKEKDFAIDVLREYFGNFSGELYLHIKKNIGTVDAEEVITSIPIEDFMDLVQQTIEGSNELIIEK